MATNNTTIANGPPAKRQRVNRGGLTADPDSITATPKFQAGDKVHVDNVLPAFTKIEMKVLRASNARTGSWEYVLDSTIIPDYESTIIVPEERVFQVKYPIGTQLVFKLEPLNHNQNNFAKITDWKFSEGQVMYDVKVGCVQEPYVVGRIFDLTLNGLGRFSGEFVDDIDLTYDVGTVQISEAELDARQDERLALLAGSSR
ncbi:uncharacterized protein AB675_4721 [Cyphellophora attinorum]|uniref:Uncharacterized protein n=1 Tax=Cyphellophora attinorum TaxID=1664694 RepID=A0A0N1NYU5_9EURO|nr:uncharacterized protein AB675_4721 [Phialophora attinorum]KPI39202.1 hypothetical protein AB675_4721 [Phialophora attinorum]